MVLRKGVIYQAVQNVFMGDLIENKKYIYVGQRSEYMVADRLPEYLISCRYYFFDVEKEKYCEWIIDGKEGHQAITLPKYLTEQKGGWSRPSSEEFKPLPIDYFDMSRGKELIRDHVSYFKSIAEGDNVSENIFVWIERYDLLLTYQMTGMEKLEFRRYPFKSICYWLDYFSVPFKSSAKYSWLDGVLNTW